MIQIVCVNGLPQSGKSTFEEYCMKELGTYFSGKISTIDYVKEMATQMGWKGEKNLETRAFLSDLKDLMSNSPWGDLPLKKVVQYCKDREFQLFQHDIEDNTTIYIFVDVREPDNIQILKDKFNAITLLVVRKESEQYETSNHADSNVYNYNYEYEIINNGTLEELEKSAKVFVKELKKFKGKEFM